MAFDGVCNSCCSLVWCDGKMYRRIRCSLLAWTNVGVQVDEYSYPLIPRYWVRVAMAVFPGAGGWKVGVSP